MGESGDCLASFCGCELIWSRVESNSQPYHVELRRRRELKVNVSKGKVKVINGEEGLEREVHVDGVRLEHVSEFKYLGCVLDKSGTYGWREREELQVSLGT